MSHPRWHLVLGWLGLIAHLATLVVYAASGLLAPGWAVVTLLLVWLALLVIAIRLLRKRPAFVPLVPVGAGLIWLGALTAGENWLGWTA
jgi:hypothetical protein